MEKGRQLNRKVLGERRYADLERHFSHLLAGYESGAISDTQVDSEFGAFYAHAPSEPLHAEWVAAYPKSRAAHLAHAHYWVNRGYWARGTAFSKETSGVQFAAMEHAFKKAWAELDAAEALAKTPLPEWSERMRVMRATSGSIDAGERIYRKALAMRPQGTLIRTSYAAWSAPKWGGSFERLAAIRDDAKSLPAESRRFVEATVDSAVADAYEIMKQPKAAAEWYERAVRGCPAYTASAQQLIRIYTDAKDYPALARIATWHIERWPDMAWPYMNRAWAMQSLNKNEEAFRDYERASQLGAAAAFEYLAYMTEWGRGTKQDYHKAIDLYMIAHSRGIKGTKEKADKIRAALGIK